ncbi:type II toxin-antitoxin system HicB family antitoxin [Treponema sp. OMZ 792]|uniref:type II toxin-antitoxin system HicB family antitoxin n=1 Tax=unclassified Treponema TaxID=2638727 RepID=UPI0020A47552|nr:MULTISPECIES: type II toxin-antitoxin system HicB family antitoxin [unclassified Treponema]UTC68305.1 type II toxin-antitoxin system HicB family antitoxin [Treponema sp. OMZ 789]UTC71026.1 type II toxin-antitoxin system HicB family antitoxin [Treponema sp. OMZ 790]UTC73767.1 type II toxin-antitoxin system HicB family antitoxin [Treponema sp. OMZ 791]UTC75864.1 type II toxin-antitoxin system HicB family antitoxin [Treponema sp. OMZ 792]UTC78329.1 HicB family protein [Treponema sp. OMZ 799]
MRKLTYLAVFEPAENGAYSVYFPSLLGCVSCGQDFYDAQAMAKEALELHVYGIEKDGSTLPREDFTLLQTNQGDIVCPITIYPDFIKAEMDNRRVRTNCTIPYSLKCKAELKGINFSQALETALTELCN